MSCILSQETDGVLSLTLDRPDKKNALTGAMYHALSDGLERAGADDAIGAVLLSGNGAAFSAGNDVNDFLSHGAAAPQAMPSVRFIRALAAFDKPLLAAVQGLAVGIGTTMLLHCDLVYASADARFSTPFAKLGLVPEAGSSLLLPRRIGAVRANAMLLLGETLDAETAVAAGLVNALLPAGTLHAQALEKARTLAALPAAALLASKALIRGDRRALDSRITEELTAFGHALASDEAKAAFAAFLNRARAP